LVIPLIKLCLHLKQTSTRLKSMPALATIIIICNNHHHLQQSSSSVGSVAIRPIIHC